MTQFTSSQYMPSASANLSKTLARQHGLYIHASKGNTLKTRGLTPLNDAGRDLLYHLHPHCEQIDHQVASGGDVPRSTRLVGTR